MHLMVLLVRLKSRLHFTSRVYYEVSGISSQKDYSGYPCPRPSGQRKSIAAQIRSRRICRTSNGSNPPGGDCKSVALDFSTA